MWDSVEIISKPIVLYGTGNACERIIALLNERGVKPSCIFASDDFVRRGKVFCGYPVVSFSECMEKFGPDMLVLLCFGTHRPEVLENIERIAEQCELLAPDIAVIPEECGLSELLFTKESETAERADIDAARALLADDQSRLVFDSVLEYKRTWDLKSLFACESSEDELPELLGLGSDEVYMDLGAYTGDTIEQFLRFTGGHFKEIIAAEPDDRNFRKLTEYVGGLPADISQKISLFHGGIGDKTEVRNFSQGTGRGSLSKKMLPVQFTSVDDLTDETAVFLVSCENPSEKSAGILVPGTASFVNDTFENAKSCGASADNMLHADGCKKRVIPTYIKMDLEGAEEEAIRGAAQAIKTGSPKLLIAAYHRIFDLWRIPLQINALDSSYKIYLRRFPCVPAWEINCICVKSF